MGQVTIDFILQCWVAIAAIVLIAANYAIMDVMDGRHNRVYRAWKKEKPAHKRARVEPVFDLE